jgi:hypothetical protein
MGRAADPLSGNVRSEFRHRFHYPTGLSMKAFGNVAVTARFVKARWRVSSSELPVGRPPFQRLDPAVIVTENVPEVKAVGDHLIWTRNPSSGRVIDLQRADGQTVSASICGEGRARLDRLVASPSRSRRRRAYAELRRDI